ncbi:uncharacterized protein LOC143333891 [Chaetodon auriga]|uniref:uncharacterized protein LOC143333891 n=1 Tax=Chaetodon auriga TaxID=39042 RepID=UPI004032D364
MPLSGDEPVCPKFQPNIFDPSRCHDCLRQRHLHAGAGASTEAAPQQKPTAETGTGTKTGTDAGIGSGKGVFLTPILSQAEERDTSSKEDSDGLSVVSSCCDVNGGRVGYQESSLCILSPDCELYICDGDDDDSTDSCRDHSDYLEFSGSISAEDEYLPIRRRSTKLGMTRLDPPPHRPNPRAWMDETRSRDNFSSRSGLKADREKRESGYFSLGRAAGAHLLRDNSPPAPFRHFERGHPIFSSRNVEPKDSIPFRNPNLGVASERQIIKDLNEDLPVEIPPPDPYEIAVEVEAQVGPRSPSPTPFKIAESLASTGRKGFSSSYGRGSPSSHVPPYQQTGRFDSSRKGSALQSRSSSPSRGNLPFRRSESATSISRHNFDDGGRTQGMEIQMRRHTSSQSSMESSESGQPSVGSTGRNREEYAMMADVPKVKMIHQREGPGLMGRLQIQQPSRRQELFKPASHSLSKHPSREWEDTGDTERDWHYGGSGYLSRAHSSTSLQFIGAILFLMLPGTLLDPPQPPEVPEHRFQSQHRVEVAERERAASRDTAEAKCVDTRPRLVRKF